MVDYDEVLWTELEFLRLHASILRTLSSTDSVGSGGSEVKKKGAPPPLPHAADALDLHVRIDALQRKALRMLHRAQLEARAGGGAGGPSPWPGVDPDAPDAEALADRYVSAVEDIKTRMAEREERRASGLLGGGMGRGDGGSDAADTGDEADPGGGRPRGGPAVGHPTAVDSDGADAAARSALLGDGLRRRGGRSTRDNGDATGGVVGGDDEDGDAALVDAQRPVQEALTDEMLALVGRLKRNAQGMADDLVTDAAVLDATDAAVDANLSGVVRQRGTLAAYAKRASLSWWTGLLGLAVALGVFLFVYLFVIKLPW
ncbi:hypothetical protein MMPV_009007 [Pyropia vietnamensis]